jgi:hypothetical protein
MKRNEFMIVIGIILVASLFVSNKLQLPSAIDKFVHTSVGKTILVILTLYGFSLSPAIGLSLTVLTAIVIFSHNVSFVNNLQTSNPLYNNSVTNFVRNLFTPSSIDAKLVVNESTEYAEMIEPHPVEGSFPSNEHRPTNYESVLEYNYRPQADTGSDDFERSGPNIDEKLDVLHE